MNKVTSVDDVRELCTNQTHFKMKFHDISAGLNTDIDSWDISTIAYFDNRIEMMNFDGIWFITDEKNIYEIEEV